MEVLPYLQITVPFISFSGNIALQIVCFKNFKKLGLLKSEYIGFFIGILIFLSFELLIYKIIPMTWLNYVSIFFVNFVIYLALVNFYFVFLNLGETARRIRLLRELYASEDGLTLNEILNKYNARDIIRMRIERLLANNQIIEKNEKFYINNPLTLLITKMTITMKLHLLGKKSEFD